MFTRDSLKRLLIAVRDDGYAVPDGEMDGVVSAMLGHIGDIDSELRDELIYGTFCTWFMGDVLSRERIKRITMESLDEGHLFLGIGEDGTDSVFTRAFSVLIVPLALIADRRLGIFERCEVLFIKDTVLRYIQCERDYRGFVRGKGWAHAMAHAADALDDIALSGHMGYDDLLGVLDALKTMASVGECVYVCDEGARMAAACKSVLCRYLLEADEAAAWLGSFADGLNAYDPRTLETVRMNRRDFLSSLCSLLMADADDSGYMSGIIASAKESLNMLEPV